MIPSVRIIKTSLFIRPYVLIHKFEVNYVIVLFWHHDIYTFYFWDPFQTRTD